MKDEELYKQLIEAKLALFAMVDQFMYERENANGEECYYDCCESAGEQAFTVLNFEDDMITKKEFYQKYDEMTNELRSLNGLEKRNFSRLDIYLEEMKYKKE